MEIQDPTNGRGLLYPSFTLAAPKKGQAIVVPKKTGLITSLEAGMSGDLGESGQHQQKQPKQWQTYNAKGRVSNAPSSPSANIREL